MKKKCRHLALLLCMIFTGCMQQRLPTSHQPPVKLVQLAEHGWQRALRNHEITSSVIVLIDFTAPSFSKRLWVYDLLNHQTLTQTYVSHGVGSGGIYAKHFSDQLGSHASSIGFYKTRSTYYGKHGYSLHLDGLEPAFNGHARSRSVIMHPAHYAGAAYIAKHHQAGRSWGCFALDPDESAHVINLAKDGHLLLAYASDKTWRHQSSYLNI